ncbi:helix-turn-helix domain-containing protein [Nostoc sp.]|uniref:helix-turn-helix domain-containing protein n=1 Tax=Nostoc sp. TaxID=1180 RepID=UPI002FF510C2
MGNSFQVEVSESQEELQHRLRHALTATTKERLQMLYWIKVGAMATPAAGIATRQELAQRLGRDELTVYRWLQRYKQRGMTALLEVKTPKGLPALIPETAINRLTERLRQPEGFKSYSQIQEWLTQECEIVAAYKTVHYKLNAKLKVPRPRSAKAKPEAQEAFKKNCQK